MAKSFLFVVLSVLILGSCVEVKHPYTILPPGKWRAVLNVGPSTNMVYRNKKGESTGVSYDDINEGELPFNFDISYVSDTQMVFTLNNGLEDIVINDIETWKNRKNGYDSIRVNFVEYGTYLLGSYKENVIEGVWVVPSKKDYSIPFIAHFGKDYRFSDHVPTDYIDVNGDWGVIFDPENDKEKAIGEFVQKGNKLTGTFMTETGDYRYLQGEVFNNKLYLSTFDGAHAFLFIAKKLPNAHLSGLFRSGSHYQTIWEGSREVVPLADPNTMTKLEGDKDDFQLILHNEKGDKIDVLNKDNGQVKIIQIMGTWCPNCKDESIFLTSLLKDPKFANIDVIGLSFERSDNFVEEQMKINKYAEFMKIPYKLYFAGKANKETVSLVLPQMTPIKSYPTMLVLGKKGRVRKIHTGFSGPATSKYANFKKEFMLFLLKLQEE